MMVPNTRNPATPLEGKEKTIKSILKVSPQYQSHRGHFPLKWRVGLLLTWTSSKQAPVPPPSPKKADNQYDDDDDGCEGEESIWFLFLQGILSVFSLILVGFITFLLVQENFLQHPGTLSPDKSNDMVSIVLICCMALFMGVLGFNSLCDLISTLEDRAASSRYIKNEPNRKKSIRFEEGTKFTRGQRPRRARGSSRRRSAELSEEEIRASARLELFLRVVEQKIIEASTKEVARRKREQVVAETKEDYDDAIDNCCVDVYDDVEIDFKPTLSLPTSHRAVGDGIDNGVTSTKPAAYHHTCVDDIYLPQNELDLPFQEPTKIKQNKHDVRLAPCNSEFFKYTNKLLSEASKGFTRMALCLLLGNEDSFMDSDDNSIILPSKGFISTDSCLTGDALPV